MKTNKPTYKPTDAKEKGCDCGAKKGYWAVEGPPFCKWSCNICYKETTVYWDP